MITAAILSLPEGVLPSRLFRRCLILGRVATITIIAIVGGLVA